MSKPLLEEQDREALQDIETFNRTIGQSGWKLS